MFNEIVILDNEIESLKDKFFEIYNKRPFIVNDGGLQMESSFILFKLLININPKFYIESGVWRGYTNWLIQHTFPTLNIISIDPLIPNILLYKNDKITYFTEDFTKIINYANKDYFLFVDDHQDVASRIIHAHKLGIKNILFDDCYNIDFNYNKHPPTLYSYLNYSHDNILVKNILLNSKVTSFKSFENDKRFLSQTKNSSMMFLQLDY